MENPESSISIKGVIVPQDPQIMLGETEKNVFFPVPHYVWT